jgi:hypothetical protein
MLFGTGLHGVFEPWWSHAETHYMGLRDGKLGDTLTLYYDPILRYDHRRGPESALMMAVYLAPQKPEVAELIFAAAAARLGWTTDAPLREPRGNPRFTLWGLILAREFGDAAIYDKLAAHCEAHHEPTWNGAAGEFTWGFGLNEPHPRGQFNATRMMAEALSEGAWQRLFNAPHLRKFSEPTVHDVDFPTVCLSQACYDAARGCLVIATDADMPHAAGQPTSFRIANMDPASCQVEIDGRPSNDWRIVEGDLEITTTVAEHVILVTHEAGGLA